MQRDNGTEVIIPLNRDFKKELSAISDKDFIEIMNPYADYYEKHLRRKNWLSIIKASKCVYSRRTGKIGVIIFGYSVCLRLFNKDVL